MLRSRLLYRAPDVKHALALKEFMRCDYTVLGASHPIGRGLLALRKYLAGRMDLSPVEEQSLASLNLQAEMVMHLARAHHREYEVRGDLRNSDRCRALLFEAHVLRYLIQQNVRSYIWRRYEPGVTDFITESPNLQVECKLVIREPSIERVLKRAFNNSHQGRPGDGSFVLVTGTDAVLSQTDSVLALDWINANAGVWFQRHRDVAAVVLVLPMPITRATGSNALGISGMLFEFGRIIALRSEVAAVPFPGDFNFVGQRN